MINTVVLQGKLGKDIDLRYTANGTAVGTVSLAVDRDYKNQQGQKETDWIQVVFWKKTAETVANYFRKGDEILVVGRIQTRSYENQQGQKVYVTEVMADKFSFTSGRKNEQHTSNQSVSNQQGNFGTNTTDKYNDPFGNSSAIDISNSDLPF